MPLVFHRPPNYNSPILKGYYGNHNKPYMQGLGNLGDTTVIDTINSASSASTVPISYFGAPSSVIGGSITPSNVLSNLQAGIAYRDNLLSQSQQGFDISGITDWLQNNVGIVVLGILGLTLLGSITGSKGRR